MAAFNLTVKNLKAKNINAKTIKASLLRVIEKQLPFEVTEETFQKIAAQVLERAKKISNEIKKDPVAAVKNYKQLLAPLETAKGKIAKKTTARKSTVKKISTKKPATKKNVH